jgi:hypothetical protein
MASAHTRVQLAGARLVQFVQIADDTWAFRQSPGHSLEMALFANVGATRLANILLAVLAAALTYAALAAWHSERAAFFGVTLLLWSPLSLLALHYYNMDTFSGGVWPLLAGGLLLGYEWQERENKYAPWLLLLAGFAAGWSVVVRQTNALLAITFGLYFLLLLWDKRPASRSRRRRRRKRARQRRRRFLDRTSWLHLAAFTLGGLLAVAILAAYNHVTFGDVFTSGYAYPSRFDAHNLWSENPVTAVPGGVDTWLAGGALWDIIVTLFLHVKLWLRPATLAWPLWPLALFGLVKLLRERRVERSTWFILAWLAAAYAFYAGVVFFGVTRALAVPFNQTWGFFAPARYLFPFIFPFAWVLGPLLAGWPKRWSFGLVALYVAGGAWIFAQTLLHTQ